jgi:RHS repeat-associated protein
MTPGIVGESDLSGNLTDEYVFFDGERVARKSTNEVFYYFSDHLKTASVVADAAGNIKSESDFYPWGGELQFVANDSNHYKFTGKERDSETQLDYFGARYYSNGLGRWVSADWSPTPIPVPYADFGDPQSLNLYSYVRNIPTTRFDANGHCDASKGWCKVLNFIGCFCQPVQPPSPSVANAVNQVADKAAPLVGKIATVAAVVGLTTNAKADQLKANQQQGKDFEKQVVDKTRTTDNNVSEQVTVKTASGVKTGVDVASTDTSGKVRF